MSIVFALERTNQLSLLPDKDLVDLCLPIEPYQVTKSHKFLELAVSGMAQYIITGDKDLLILNTYQGIPIITPAEFLVIF